MVGIFCRSIGEKKRTAFVREHSDSPTDNLRRLTYEFGAPPEELLTHSPVFGIPKTP